MSNPPPLPADVLARVLRISGVDAFILVILAGGFGIISSSIQDWIGAAVGALAAGSGVIELSGRKRLKNRRHSGVRLLVTSQLLLLAVIVSYATYQYFTYDPVPTLERLENEMRAKQRDYGLDSVSFSESLGMSPTEFKAFMRTSARTGYLAVGAASVLFQGALAYYYHRKGQRLHAFLQKS